MTPEEKIGIEYQSLGHPLCFTAALMLCTFQGYNDKMFKFPFFPLFTPERLAPNIPVKEV